MRASIGGFNPSSDLLNTNHHREAHSQVISATLTDAQASQPGFQPDSRPRVAVTSGDLTLKM